MMHWAGSIREDGSTVTLRGRVEGEQFTSVLSDGKATLSSKGRVSYEVHVVLRMSALDPIIARLVTSGRTKATLMGGAVVIELVKGG